MADPFFGDVEGRIPFGGPDATEPLTYTVYEPNRTVLGKRMEDHLRIGVCLWHSFAWDGRNGQGDVVGSGGYLVLIEAQGAGSTLHVIRRKVAVVR